MLEAQQQLTNANVSIWAEEAYTEYLQLAENGDKQYREREFIKAQKSYEQALTGFTTLIERIEPLFDETMTRGAQALIEGDSAVAIGSFELALQLKPDDADANTGLQRAKTLDQVFALMDEAETYHKQGELEQAQQAYQQALELDAKTEQAHKQLQRIKQDILQRNFNQTMSRGYTALESDKLEQAQQLFLQALKLKGNSSEAESALRQTRTRITTNKINVLLQQAEAAAMAEQWQQSLELYNETLKLDASLRDAREGGNYAERRLLMDQRLQQTLQNPDRLASKAVYKEAVGLLARANEINTAGPRLEQQRQQLSESLAKYRTPIKVNLLSNEKTEVTIYKVGKLGQFSSKELSLLPGRYVAVGTRTGYRDVRTEFLVKKRSSAPDYYRPVY